MSVSAELTAGLWASFLDAKIAALGTVDLDAFADMLELFGRAQAEYLCKLSPRVR